MGSFSVDSEGYIWWILNPDFLLYKVASLGAAELFAQNLPIDSGSAHRNSDGDLFLNTPEGIFRIWEPTLGERVQLIIEDLDDLGDFAVLNEGRCKALQLKLESAVSSLNRGDSKAAEHQLKAFLRSLGAYIRVGIIPEERADTLILAVEDVLARLLSIRLELDCAGSSIIIDGIAYCVVLVPSRLERESNRSVLK
jgi:hypothetical protein